MNKWISEKGSTSLILTWTQIKTTLRYCACKLDNQEGQWCNSVQAWRPKNQDVQGQEMVDVPAQGEKREFVLSLCFCSIQVLSGLDDTNLLLITWRVNQMLISPGNSLTNTPRNNALPATWVSPSTVQ